MVCPGLRLCHRGRPSRLWGAEEAIVRLAGAGSRGVGWGAGGAGGAGPARLSTPSPWLKTVLAHGNYRLVSIAACTSEIKINPMQRPNNFWVLTHLPSRSLGKKRIRPIRRFKKCDRKVSNLFRSSGGLKIPSPSQKHLNGIFKENGAESIPETDSQV